MVLHAGIQSHCACDRHAIDATYCSLYGLRLVTIVHASCIQSTDTMQEMTERCHQNLNTGLHSCSCVMADAVRSNRYGVSIAKQGRPWDGHGHGAASQNDTSSRLWWGDPVAAGMLVAVICYCGMHNMTGSMYSMGLKATTYCLLCQAWRSCCQQAGLGD